MNPSINQSLFLWLNHACATLPDWFWASLTITGHTSVVFALCAPLLLRKHIVITGLFASAIVGGLVSTVLKETFQISRPPAVLAADAFHLIGHKLELVSFPSGHTLSAFAAATLLTLGLGLRGWRLAGLLLLAALVGLSRIAVGAHWPLDVLGGAVLGSLCALVGWQMALRCHGGLLWPSRTVYKMVQTLILFVSSCSLFVIKTGYPEAIVWQYIVAAFGALFAAYSILLLLRSVK
jgi:membrane-associated phospholipid phosphatase